MDRLALLKELTLLPGISGFEYFIKDFMIEQIGELAPYEQDRLGQITFTMKGQADKPKILFIAHQDEIGFMVADVMDSGLIQFHPIGGWNKYTLLSSPVEIITQSGKKHVGVFGSVPVHFTRGGKDRTPEISDMFIDIGAKSRKDAFENFGINIGDPIIPIPYFYYEERNRRIISKAFDDRAGIAALIELGKALKDTSHPNTVYLNGSVQEEVGGSGSRTLARTMDADICVVLEGAPADDIPGIPFRPQTCVGKGAHMRVYDPSMIGDPKLKDIFIQLAKKHNIPLQVTLRRGGGTDGRHIQTSAHGIPSIVCGVPVRYAHSHNSMISLDDFDALIKLLVEFVKVYK
ncbi:MAG: M42 family metallopeptidase [Candidatus Cloacimonetes bacterium]|nr:M42 family metallopeptidase [Candidatus Cloacimonadota bacterium]